jgi:hypothetical protein
MEPDRNPIDDNILTGDEIPSIDTEFIETKTYRDLEMMNKHKLYVSKKIRPGYLDKNIVFTGNTKKHPVFRFMQKSLSGQDDDYFNKETGTNDPNKPSKEIEMLRKEGLSNGVLVVDRKRICNFETGKYPEYYLDLRKD